MNKAIEDYLKTSFFSADSVLQFEEIGEGNINHVYRVRSKTSGKSLILKQAEKKSRISPEIQLNVSRGQQEANYLRFCRSLIPDALPQIYDYNKALRLIIMEDLGDRYEVLRTALLAEKRFDFLGKKLADYLTETTFFTSDFSLSHQKKKRMQKAFLNPALCDLTERLVFSDPFLGAKENRISDANTAYIQKNVRLNARLQQAAAELKFRFMNESQALIHGDLHFGSVFVNDRNIVIFDPEFCFFGPIGFDLGNLFAHFLLERLFHSIKAGDKKDVFSAWLKQMAEDLLFTFEESFAAKAKRNCKDGVLANPLFIEDFVSSVLTDTAGFAGAECIRRTVGIAKIPEFDRLSAQEREKMERDVIRAGVFLMENKKDFKSASDLIRFWDRL